MSCLSCAERARLLRQGAQSIVNGRPVQPIVNQFQQTIVRDVRRLATFVNPRLGVRRQG